MPLIRPPIIKAFKRHLALPPGGTRLKSYCDSD